MYNLDRFINAQKIHYEKCLNEIKNGRKETHWIWYIFPQLRSLGQSEISDYYGISNLEEAKEYIKNEYLRHNLVEISSELLKIDDDILNIMGHPDNLKLQSSMTLFKYADEQIEVFNEVLDKFYEGLEDEKTLSLLNISKRL